MNVSPPAALLAVGALLLGIGRFALTFHEKERALAGLHLRATTDPLTNLPNHREFHERLAAEVDRARRHGRDLSVVVLDLDHFKLVNDTYGHPMGDRALIHVADTLREVVRPGDTLARIGGEEFGWILPETSALEAWQATDRARRLLLASPVPRAGQLNFSAGVCDLEQVNPPLGGAELVRLADGALYWAKRNGRGVTFRYSPIVVTALTAEEMARSAVREQSLATVRVLARAVDARDPHTLEHSERVADLAVAIARDLGWWDPQAALLQEAALVHDIGKIGVPDEVLLKPGPLTSQERALIEAHARRRRPDRGGGAHGGAGLLDPVAPRAHGRHGLPGRPDRADDPRRRTHPRRGRRIRRDDRRPPLPQPARRRGRPRRVPCRLRHPVLVRGGQRPRPRPPRATQPGARLRLTGPPAPYRGRGHPRRGGRAVECDGLENRCPVTPGRGFESLPLRSFLLAMQPTRRAGRGHLRTGARAGALGRDPGALRGCARCIFRGGP